MKNKAYNMKSIILILIFMLPFKIFATNISNDELVKRVLIESGIDRQLSSYNEVLSLTIDQAFALEEKISDEEKYRLKSNFLNNLNNEKLIKLVEINVGKRLTKSELNKALKIYKDPFFKKFLQSEVNSANPEALQEMAIFVSKIGQNSPSNFRLQLINRLDAATKSTESSKVIVNNIFVSVMKNLNKINKKYTEDQLSEIINNYIFALEQGLGNQVKLFYLFTYKDFTDKELEKYITIYEENSEQTKINDALISSVNDLFVEYAVLVSNNFAQI